MRLFFTLAVCLLACECSAEVKIQRNVPAADPLSGVCLNPWKGDYVQPEDIGLSAQAVAIPNAFKKNLRGWFIPADGAKQTILFCMGNSGNISLMLPYAKILHDGKFNVLLFDYQGFGNSEGAAALNSLLTDALAAYDFLTKQKRIAKESIGVFGVSLGSVLALRVAAERDVAAVAVEDVFIPDDIINQWQDQITNGNPLAKIGLQSVKTLLISRVNPLSTIKQLDVPLFFFHGEKDWLLPPVASLKLAQLYDGPKRVWMMPGTGHAPESLEINDREYASQLQTFFQNVFANTLHEPQLQLRTQPLNNGFQITATVKLPNQNSSATPVPVQITLSDGEQFQFERIAVSGSRVLMLDCPFEPTYSAATVIHHAQQSPGKAWTADLSAFSKALADYRKTAFEIFGSEEKHNNIVNGSYIGMVQMQIAKLPFPTDTAVQLLRNRPDKTAPDRIRTRYARLYARLYRWDVRQGAQRTELQKKFAAAMVDCLPKDPAAYFEVGNAMFDLEFRDPFVAENLLELALEQFAHGDASSARTLLAHYRSIHGRGYESLTDERIRQISSADDLRSTLKR